MPMLEGVIVINPATGSFTTKTGCAGSVIDVLVAGSNFGTLASANPPAYAAALEQLAVMARAIAKVVPHIVANATVAPGIAVSTTGTAAAQTGATTAPGTVS